MPDYRSGIYRIIHVATGREYIGSAVKFSGRWSVHKTLLKQGKHHSPYLQRVYDKYGLGSLAFEPIELVDDQDNLIQREQHWIDERHPVFNVSPTAGSTLGKPCRPETRQKISEANKGNNVGWHHTEETCAVIAAAAMGNQRTKGRVVPPEERAIRSERALARGFKHTPESKEKLSAAKRGKPGRVWTDESRQKLSDSKRGKPRPPHVIEAMNEGRRRKRANASTDSVPSPGTTTG